MLTPRAGKDGYYAVEEKAELGFPADPAAVGARFMSSSIVASKPGVLRKLQEDSRVEETQ